MTITGITPTQGPSKGGTVITIFGENLGIGNRKIESVEFNHVKCAMPQVRPDISVAVVANGR